MMATHRSHIAAISAHIAAISAYIVAMRCPHRYDDGPSFVMMTCTSLRCGSIIRNDGDTSQSHRTSAHIVAISAHIVAISAYIVAMRCPHRYDDGPIIRNDDVHIATMWIHHS